ncbi:MAG: hypothetical protein E7261_01445 [Lachnospiraceae bacterium]|nr:hypothetical protein [Lachnospiraceae bacterium]
MEILFLKLLNMSIVASWVVLAVILFRLLLKKAPKYIRCIMWMLVGVRLICPFSFKSNLSLIPSAEVLPEDVLSGPQFVINTGLGAVDSRINAHIGDRYFEGVTVSTGSGSETMQILSCVWLAGMLVMLAYTIISYIRTRKGLAEAVECTNGIWLCDHVKTPFILGVFNPRIFLPACMNEADKDYVVAHEKAHLKRFDHIWKPIGFLLLTIYWFNPVMWIAYILLCRDIELACDEKVIKDMGLEGKKLYSEALINCSMKRRWIIACPLAFGEVGVKERIKTVLSYKKPAFWIVIVAVVTCMVMGVCFLTNPKGVKLCDRSNISADELPDFITILIKGETNYDVLSEASMIYVLDLLTEIEVSRNEISLSRSEDRDKSNAIILHSGDVETRYYFNNDCTEVWVDDGVKPSLTKKVYKPEIVRQFFDSCIESYAENITYTGGTDNTFMLTGIYKIYVYSDSIDYMKPTISLNEEEKTFSFSYSGLSSYLPYGEYELTEDTLTLYTSGGFYTYVFDVVNNGFVFDASRSSKIPAYRYSKDLPPEYPVPDGALFEMCRIVVP